jgi:8-oxo-dGTP diphosphatase
MIRWQGGSEYGKGIKTHCGKARAGLVGEKKERPVMNVPGRSQAWSGNGKRLPAQGNPGGASKTQTGRLKLWKEIKANNPRSGRKMNDAIFIANNASGRLAIGDKQEIDKATWLKPHPRGIRLTPTSRYIRDKLFPKRS